MSNFALLDSQFGEENPVRQPRSARAARGQHRYDGTIVNNKAVGYVPVEREYAEYPKMLYHPKWGMTPKPEAAKFAIGAVTADQFQAAFAAFTAAEEQWSRTNRLKMVESAEDEKRLLAKGWLAKPPARKENPAFDMSSDAI